MVKVVKVMDQNDKVTRLSRKPAKENSLHTERLDKV